jgi:hypothetical protein
MREISASTGFPGMNRGIAQSTDAATKKVAA